MANNQQRVRDNAGIPPDDMKQRLPVWAQEYIKHLERQNSGLLREITKANDGPADSNIKIHTYGIYPDRLLGSDEPVEFYLGESRERWDDMVIVRHGKDGELDVTGHGSVSDQGRRELVVLPRAYDRLALRFVNREKAK